MRQIRQQYFSGVPIVADSKLHLSQNGIHYRVTDYRTYDRRLSRENGESQNWLPRYRGCQWKVGDGYEEMISSVNARSLLIRRYYFGTSPRSSLRRKRGMKERVNAPRYLCEFESRLDTRGLARRSSEVIRLHFEKKRKKNATRRSGITARPFPVKTSRSNVIEQY